MILFGAVAVNQYLEYKNVKNTIKDGEEIRTYLSNLNIGDLSWADIYYGSFLFIPSVILVLKVSDHNPCDHYLK